MVADVSRFLSACGEEYKKSSKEQNVESKTKIDKLSTYWIGRIANIALHHCGDHSNFRADDCVIFQTQHTVIAKHRSEEKSCDTKLSTK